MVPFVHNHAEMATRGVRAGAAILVAVAIIVLLLLVDIAAQALLLVFAGVLFGTGLRGAAAWLARRLRIGPRLGLALALGISLAIAAGIAMWIVPRVDQHLGDLFDTLVRAYRDVRSQLEQWDIGRRLLDNLAAMPTDLAPVSQATNVLLSTIGVIGAMVFVAFVAVYLASSPATYTRAVIRLVPLAHRPRATDVLAELGRTLRRWLLGRVVSMTAVGVATALGLWLLGIPLAVTLGLVAGAFGFVPNIGPIVSAVPALLIAATIDGAHVLYVLVLYIVINLADGYILTPAIERRAVYLPPALVISMQIVVGAMFGVLGLMFATPLLACAVVLVHRFYVEDILENPTRQIMRGPASQSE